MDGTTDGTARPTDNPYGRKVKTTIALTKPQMQRLKDQAYGMGLTVSALVGQFSDELCGDFEVTITRRERPGMPSLLARGAGVGGGEGGATPSAPAPAPAPVAGQRKRA